MSVAAIRRSFLVIHHLKTQGETRFTDLVRLLSPISRTALSHLLASLEEIGELEHDGRKYRLAPTAAALAGSAHTIYALPPALSAQTRPILARVTAETHHSCALFARVGTSTMKVMDVNNLAAPHPVFGAVGHELPLVPFNGFARLFLAYSPETLARECYQHWLPYLRPNPNVRVPASEGAFIEELVKVRRHGYALEYKDELQPIMRVALPVTLPESSEVRFSVGIVANFVYLLQVKSYIESLRQASAALSGVLAGKVPTNVFDSYESRSGEFSSSAVPFPASTLNEFGGSRTAAATSLDEAEAALIAS